MISTKAFLIPIISFILLSCSTQEILISYDDRIEVENDKDLTEIFQKQLDDKINKGGYTIFINPYISDFIILDNTDTIHFQKENTEDDDILGRTWIQRDYKANGIDVKYDKKKYNIKFIEEYRYITLSYDDESQRLSIEYTKFPWVTYHE